ncbi:hypothetical protein ACOTTU_00990 [Roseobacter sp. EG26]|uniref:hypothetical protein n=1 Tax=Roseobacter sp. EG26 TaxID=3412477 RepID=UPI003CE5AEF9
MPLIHTRKDIDDLLGGPTEAEEKLLTACMAGESCALGGLPRADDATREVRAEVLRYLILGGCEACHVHGWGVRLYGACVSGTLDLSFEKARRATVLIRCRFAEDIIAQQSKLDLLVLNGSTLNVLSFQGIKVRGGVLLRDITASGEVTLSGAQIGGQLSCEEAAFSATNGHALTMQRAHIREGLIWRSASFSKGSVNLTAAYVGDLVDDLTSWPGAGRLILDGFTYDRISGAPTDAARRLDWLAKGSTWNGEFSPQPYTQLAKVLREMGHDAQARTVLAERERLLYREKFKTRWRLHNGEVSEGITVTNIHYLTILWSYFLQAVVGYGHRPFRSVLALLVLWLSATTVAHLAWEEGSFAPNSGPVLLSDDWQRFASEPAPANPALLWSEKGAQGQDWESFSPHAYAADLVIPIVDIGQTAAWAPSTTRGFWGWHLWWLRWVFTLAGWVVTALGAAAITGIIRRD